MSRLRKTISDSADPFPCRVVIVAGTYDGVLIGWDTDEQVEEREDVIDDDEVQVCLKMSFAFSAHEGSIRSICIANCMNKGNSAEQHQPGKVVSAGYLDESLVLLDLNKHQQVGEAKLPIELGTPTCIAFAPADGAPTHALVGTSSGKIAVYSLINGDEFDEHSKVAKKRNKNKKSNIWNIVHILSGHSCTSTSTAAGVSCIAVHPTGKLALSSGNRDSTICVWDLMKGRLAHIHKLSPRSKSSQNKVDISNLLWSKDGVFFSFCYDSFICVRHAITGQVFLDVDLNEGSHSNKGKRVNDMCFLSPSSTWLFLALVCDDGSLPVFCIDTRSSTSSSSVIHAIMAIHGVDRVVVGTDRLKFIRSLSSFYVVTANTGGVVSIIDLSGAVKMLLSDVTTAEKETDQLNDDGDEEELAAEFLSSVRVGTGARITYIAVWHSQNDTQYGDKSEVQQQLNHSTNKSSLEDLSSEEAGVATDDNNDELTIRARQLVEQAKKRQRRGDKRQKRIHT
jgi:WD40 repeat protein